MKNFSWFYVTLRSIITVFIFATRLAGQTNDTSIVHNLPAVTIISTQVKQDIQRLEPVRGTYIFSGKKNEVIELMQKNVAITEKYGRQIFAKVPGVFVYDMDGTGNQVNIATRGLDPHRSWEFNIRKDGIITNSDMYGYPASHYNIPLEAVERIEIVRGTGSLQYGAQFGGSLNYISKLPDTSSAFSFESINTVGSYGLVSTFNGASGTMGKFRYSAWFNKKWITGYRSNSDSQYDAEGLSLFYDATKNFHVKLEWTHSNYITHLAGPLTDSMFHADPRMSTRSRNYYSPDIHVPSLTIDWNILASTRIQFTASSVLGARNSVLFDKVATIPDAINPSTLQYANRQVDIDHFNSYVTELRILQSYKFLKQHHAITAGVQYMDNNLHRQQLGKGTTGSDFDLSLVVPGWGRDLHYKTGNIALFAENRWLLSRRFSINAGFRKEMGRTDMSGVITYYTENAIPNTIKHNFPLFGISTQYDLNSEMNLYGGWSQAYRPVIFKDIIPASVFEIADKNLKDAKGYNAEAGFRGKWKMFKWDITGFYLKYDNRLGTLAQSDNAGNLIVYRTNIGNSATKGIEFFFQGNTYLGQKSSISVFTSTSYMDARYQNAIIKSGTKNVNIDGNKVESVPAWISRSGITLNYANASFSGLYSYTGSSFAEALNTLVPSVSGATGLVPSYQLVDLNLALQITSKIKIQLNANNVFDEHYFTKRPLFYPGPGIWPSDGRTFSATIAIKV